MKKRSIQPPLENPDTSQLEKLEGIKSWYLINKDTEGSTKGMFEILEFSPGAKQESHRYLNCETVTFVLQGSISHLGSEKPVRLKEWEVVYNPPGEWQGYYNDSDRSTRLIKVYSGAGSLEETGYEPYNPKEPKPTSSNFRILPAPGDILNDPSLTYDPFLTEERGFKGMGNHWYVTEDTVNSQNLLVSITRFAPNGTHVRHTHDVGEEFFFILKGGGTHLLENSKMQLQPGEVVFTPVDTIHGFQNNSEEVTLVFFGWFGANNPEASGYKVV